MTQDIETIFAVKGVLSRSIRGYENRAQQTRMAHEVFDSLMAGERLIVEAPTGTGKTLAYLVAAALTRKKTVISTGTKNLQEQLFFKDLPFVKKHMFPKLKVALLKGRGNFVCHTRLKSFLRQPYIPGLGHPQSLERIVDWYHWTLTHGKGDRAELDDLPENDPVWPEICSTMETCVGRRCEDRDDCFVMAMRGRAATADLMVVNHHLLMSDLSVKESGFGEVIPRYEAVVLDEAHGLEEAATQHFGFHLTRYRINRLARDIGIHLQEATGPVQALTGLLQELPDAGSRLLSLFPKPESGRALLGRPSREVIEARDVLVDKLGSVAASLGALSEPTDELLACRERAATLKGEVLTVLNHEPSGEYACWIEYRDARPILHASPVEVGKHLKRTLYQHVPAVAFTSATLSADGSFDYFRMRLGLDEAPAPRELILDSPFDYRGQTMLYIPRALPEPNAPTFGEAMAGLVKEILERTRGRAFVLFTSYRNMNQTYKRLVDAIPFPLLVQGSRPRHRILEDFRNTPGAVLFATSSFWEGVDVQGEALSCVIVDRLPFAPPDDPIVSARMDRLRREGTDAFRSFQVPMAVIALKQGLGRLIRTRADRGVLCILDRRIMTKPYGRIFQRSLFESPVSNDIDSIADFLRESSTPRSGSR
jgi:ATP-dependent DNA helicase DinG